MLHKCVYFCINNSNIRILDKKLFDIMLFKTIMIFNRMPTHTDRNREPWLRLSALNGKVVWATDNLDQGSLHLD